mgnify:CR=1 FL=1
MFDYLSIYSLTEKRNMDSMWIQPSTDLKSQIQSWYNM